MIVLHILLLILEIIGIILLCVLALIILACFIPVGVTAEYSRDGVLVLVHAGPVKIQLLPKGKAGNRETKEGKKTKKGKEKNRGKAG